MVTSKTIFKSKMIIHSKTGSTILLHLSCRNHRIPSRCHPRKRTFLNPSRRIHRDPSGHVRLKRMNSSPGQKGPSKNKDTSKAGGTTPKGPEPGHSDYAKEGWECGIKNRNYDELSLCVYNNGQDSLRCSKREQFKDRST